MGPPLEPSRTALRRSQRRSASVSRRAAPGRRSFTATTRALEALSDAGAKVSVTVLDLDTKGTVFAGDGHVALPLGAVGMLPLLVEMAAAFEQGSIDPLELVDRSTIATQQIGIARHLLAPGLTLNDLVVLFATSRDPLAANALIDRVGLQNLLVRAWAMGLRTTTILDQFRDRRTPDDAPHVAVGSTSEVAAVMADLVNARVVSAAVSAQVSEWLSWHQDLTLVGAPTGLDPLAHEHDKYDLLFLNFTGRERGIRSEVGALAGPRAGVAYSLTVAFDDLSLRHRLRVHDAFRTLGLELMEYTH